MRRLTALLVGATALLTACAFGPPRPPGGPAPQAPPTAVATTMPTAAPTATPPAPTATPIPLAAPAPATPATASALPVAPSPIGVAAETDVSVTVGEALLTRRLDALLGGQPLAETPFGTAAARDLAVELRDGQMRATGSAQAGFVRLPVRLSMEVVVLDGRPRVAVRDARVGDVPLPAASHRRVEQVLQEEVDEVVAREDVRVRSITIGDGILTIRGTRP